MIFSANWNDEWAMLILATVIPPLMSVSRVSFEFELGPIVQTILVLSISIAIKRTKRAEIKLVNLAVIAVGCSDTGIS